VNALRALAESVEYIDANMPAALGFDTQKELLDYALGQASTLGHSLV
jgi:hypothetical protein